MKIETILLIQSCIGEFLSLIQWGLLYLLLCTYWIIILLNKHYLHFKVLQHCISLEKIQDDEHFIVWLIIFTTIKEELIEALE